MIAYIRQLIAIRRLNRLVAKQRNSFECERYRRNRAAQINRRELAQ